MTPNGFPARESASLVWSVLAVAAAVVLFVGAWRRRGK